MSLQLAMKINIVLHYFIGFVGMHLLLTRVIGITFLPALIYLATLVTTAGAPAIHLRVGHSVFLPGFYLPLQLYFFFTAFKTGEWKYVLLASSSMALMVFNGGTHILPMSVAALGMFRRWRGYRTTRLAPAGVLRGVWSRGGRLLRAQVVARGAIRGRGTILGYAKPD